MKRHNGWEMIQNSKLVIIKEDDATYAKGGIVDAMVHLTDIDDDSMSCMIKGEPVQISPDNSIWLPTFPEKDSQGNMCWSGDLIEDEWGNRYLLSFTNYSWELLKFNYKGKIVDVFELTETRQTRLGERIRSAFDKDAAELTGFDPDTITNLKQMIGVK